MRRAEAAVYQAKRYGGDYVQFYEPAFGMRSRRIDLDTELRKALEAGNLDIVYQPIVRLEDNSIAGFEALTRWEHPLHGRIPPSEFIAAAEESGLIVQLGLYVLEHAARELASWQSALASDAAALRLDQRIEPPAPAARPHQRREGGAGAHRRRAGDAEARDHRIAGDAEPGIRREGAGAHPRAWRRPGARRFRHRLFGALLPAALPLRHDQDRQVLRAPERLAGARDPAALDRHAWRTTSAWR